MSMDNAEQTEVVRGETGPAERYVEARREELRGEDRAEDRAFAEEKAGEIRVAIDKGETTREAIEADWAKADETRDARIATLSGEWDIDRGLVQRFDAILDDPDALPDCVADATDLKADAQARIEDYKAELDQLAAEREAVAQTREALGWTVETPDTADAAGDEADWVPEPEETAPEGTDTADGGSPDTAPEGTAETVMPPLGDGVGTPQNERTYFVAPSPEKTESKSSVEQPTPKGTDARQLNEDFLLRQILWRQAGR